MKGSNVGNNKDKELPGNRPIVLSFLFGFFGFFLLPFIVEPLGALVFPNNGSDIHFLIVGLEKFLIVIWILLTVLLIEHNTIASLGIKLTDIKTFILHSFSLFAIITAAFFVIFLPGLFLSGDIGPGFTDTEFLIVSPYFWFFILASAITEEILFRAFFIMRFAWISETKSVALLSVSLIYGFLHYSLWGSVGALSFGVWGFIIGFYYVYVNENVLVTSTAHLLSDVAIFLICSAILGLG